MYTAPTVLRDLALLLSTIIGIFNILIWIRIILTWVKIPRGNAPESQFSIILGKIVDPFLNIFKGARFLQSKNMDFSPLLAFAVLSIIKSILEIFGRTGTLTMGITAALIFQTVYSFLVSPLLFLLIILLGIRLFFCYKRTPTTIAMARSIETIIGGLLNWVQKNFFGSRGVANRTLVITSLIFTIVLYILIRIGFVYIINFFATL